MGAGLVKDRRSAHQLRRNNPCFFETSGKNLVVNIGELAAHAGDVKIARKSASVNSFTGGARTWG